MKTFYLFYHLKENKSHSYRRIHLPKTKILPPLRVQNRASHPTIKSHHSGRPDAAPDRRGNSKVRGTQNPQRIHQFTRSPTHSSPLEESTRTHTFISSKNPGFLFVKRFPRMTHLQVRGFKCLGKKSLWKLLFNYFETAERVFKNSK